jgi:hypothetical protein
MAWAIREHGYSWVAQAIREWPGPFANSIYSRVARNISLDPQRGRLLLPNTQMENEAGIERERRGDKAGVLIGVWAVSTLENKPSSMVS